MKIVVAPEQYELQPNETVCFLAGGITNCPDWQNVVLHTLDMFDKQYPGKLDNLVVFNPRRENFPIDDPNAAYEQIAWEFNWLQKMDVFTMYFSEGDSDQPICLYELGRNIMTMMQRFSNDYAERIVVSYDKNYRRAQDVKIQTDLAFAANSAEPKLFEVNSVNDHALAVLEAVLTTERNRKNNASTENTETRTQPTSMEAEDKKDNVQQDTDMLDS